MKVVPNLFQRITMTTYASEGESGDTEDRAVLITMVANSNTGLLDILVEHVNKVEPWAGKIEEPTRLELYMNPGSLAQFCAAYLGVYHDTRSMK